MKAVLLVNTTGGLNHSSEIAVFPCDEGSVAGFKALKGASSKGTRSAPKLSWEPTPAWGDFPETYVSTVKIIPDNMVWALPNSMEYPVVMYNSLEQLMEKVGVLELS